MEKTRSNETKQKISKTLTGRKQSAEHIAAKKEAWKRKMEAKRKMREGVTQQ